MRDERRIPIVLSKIAQVWEKYPDLRFMQLISIVQSKQGSDMFYVEDDEFVRALDETFSEKA